MRTLSKSVVQTARVALHAAEQTLPRYASKYSRKDFTLPQLAACLVVARFYRLDYRGAEALLEEHDRLRKVLGLEQKVPDHSTLCRAQRKLGPKQFKALLKETVHLSERAHMLPPDHAQRKTLVADATGMRSDRASRHFYRYRKGPRSRSNYRRWPKWVVGIDRGSHVVLAQQARTGPSPDCPEFKPLFEEAQENRPSQVVLADAGFDSHENLESCREAGAEGVIRVKHTGPAKTLRQVKSPLRKKLFKQFPKRTYGQRWQVESFNSAHKRRFGDVLGSRKPHVRRRELLLRGVLHNVALVVPE